MSEKSTQSRFRGLLLSLIGFIVLISVILATNYYANKQITRNSGVLDATGELSDQSYEMTVLLQALSLESELEQQDVIKQDIIDTRNNIDQLLSLLKTGGRYDYGDNTYINVSALQTPSNKQILDKANTIWANYETVLDPALSNNGDFIAYSAAANTAYNSYGEMYDTLDELYVDRFEHSQQWGKIARWVLIVGVLVAIVYFGWFVFYFMRKLINSEEQLQKARQQTDDILATTNDGLFLIDDNFVIADKYSNRLQDILRKEELSGKKLTDILEQTINKEDLETTQVFIEQLYNSWVVEDLIQDLNPLKNVKVTNLDRDGLPETRYLDFDFMRVIKDEQVDRVLVSVSDVTKSIELEHRLEQEQKQNNRQIEMVSTILSMDSVHLIAFMQNTQQRLNNVNQILKNKGNDVTAMKAKAHQIYREMHSLKGEASAIGFTAYVTLAERFEDMIKRLLKKTDLLGNDFLPMTVQLEELFQLTQFVNDLTNKLHLYDEKQHDDKQPLSSLIQKEQTESKPPINETQQQIDFFAKFINDIAERQNKQVNLTCNEWQTQRLSESQKVKIKDMTIQLIRNAVVHGIETADQRVDSNKHAEGNITLQLQDKGNNQLVLSCHDDGRGIDFDSVVKSAIRSGIVDASKADTLSKKQIIQLMFTPQVSTAAETSEDAGKGIGMDIVKAISRQLKGQLHFRSKPYEYTEFTITFPLN